MYLVLAHIHVRYQSSISIMLSAIAPWYHWDVSLDILDRLQSVDRSAHLGTVKPLIFCMMDQAEVPNHN